MRKIRNLILAQQARDDLIEIWLYIASDSPSAADIFIDYIYEQAKKLCSNSELGRKRNELIAGIRSFPVKKYLIFYRITKDDIEIVRVLNGYRDVDTLL